MKITLIALVLMIGILASCKKNENKPAPAQTNANRGNVTFKIDNVEKRYTKLNSFNKGVLSLSNTTNELIAISIPVPKKTPVTYNMDSKNIITASYKINNKTYNSTNGSLGIGRIGSLEIKVTKYQNSKISGTFKFTGIDKANAANKIVITNGVFTDIPNL